jgi:putative exporter of polyketide antibiotics
MATVSTARKLGIAARIASQQLRRSRTYGALLNAGRMTVGRLGAVLHQLWLEITGFIFLAFALIGWSAVAREYTAYHSGKGSPSHLAAASGFSLLFSWFGISSFRKARNRS